MLRPQLKLHRKLSLRNNAVIQPPDLEGYSFLSGQGPAADYSRSLQEHQVARFPDESSLTRQVIVEPQALQAFLVKIIADSFGQVAE